jgi:hypothetical protein
MPSIQSILPRHRLPFLAFCSLLAGAAGAMPVEVNHPVSGFLRRLEEKGVIRGGFWSTLPRDSREVASVLLEAEANKASLSAWDRGRLQRYLNEFDPPRRKAGTRLKYEDSLFTVIAAAEYYTGMSFRDSLPHGDGWAFGSFSPGVEGSYGRALYFGAKATVAQERNLHGRFYGYNYNPDRGMPYNVDRDAGAVLQEASTFDGFRAVIGFGDGPLALEAGQDWNQWGPGHWQHATLGSRSYFWVNDSLAPSPADSKVDFAGNADTYFTNRRGYRYPGENAPMPQLRFRLGTGRFEYVKIVADRQGLSKDSSAWLVAHRVQLRLGNWKFGGTEMLSVGNRSLDPVVFIPGVPLKMAEHDGGDLDNSAMAGDVEWTIPGRGRVYAELLLDDFSGPPLDLWGNKFSYVVGGSLQDPFGLPSEWHLEYAHVDPWVYGHHLYNTAMQHYGSLLGSVLPPNSHAVFASATFPLPAGMEGTVEWRFRQRDLKSLGSSIFDDWFDLTTNPEPKEKTKQFLMRDVETRHEATASVDWSWNRYVRLRGGLGGAWVSNFGGKPGASLFSPHASGEVWLRY